MGAENDRCPHSGISNLKFEIAYPHHPFEASTVLGPGGTPEMSRWETQRMLRYVSHES